eukprot:SAG31_NODE_295_length_18239_cov_15.063065_8_plen_176_part_00
MLQVAIVSATTRKAFTIGLSMLIFPKPVVAAHFYGMALFFMGLSISGWLNHTRKAASNEGEKAPRGSKASPKRRAQNPMAELERHTSSQGGDGQGGAMIWACAVSQSLPVCLLLGLPNRQCFKSVLLSNRTDGLVHAVKLSCWRWKAVCHGTAKTIRALELLPLRPTHHEVSTRE